MAGGEYAEKRIPELMAMMIAQHQDADAVAGVISDWLRTHFVDENQTAATFWVAKAIRRRGGRFFMAAAEALETLPAVAEQLRTHPDIQSGTPEERRTKFGAAISDKFRESYEAAKERLGHIPITLGSSMPSSTGPSLGERLSGFFASASAMGGRIADLALTASQFVITGLGLCVAYLIACVVIAWKHPEMMDAFAWQSFAWLVGVPTVGMIVGILGMPFGRIGGIIQIMSLATLSLISSSLLVIVFTMAPLCDIIAYTNGSIVVTKEPHWGTIAMTLVVLTVWWVVFSLLQKFLATPGFFVKFLPFFINDFSIDAQEAKALADHWNNSNAIDKIIVPVASVVSTGMLVLTALKLVVQPLPLILAVGFLGMQFLMVGVFVRMNIRLSRESDYPGWLGLGPTIKKWMGRLYESTMTTALLVVTLLLLGAGVVGFITTDRAQSWWTHGRDSTLNGAERAGEAVVRVADRVTEPDDQTGLKAVTLSEAVQQESGSRESGTMMKCVTAGKVSKAKVDEDKLALGAGFCEGGMTGYPCDCH
jgi:hypothetical protein